MCQQIDWFLSLSLYLQFGHRWHRLHREGIAFDTAEAGSVHCEDRSFVEYLVKRAELHEPQAVKDTRCINCAAPAFAGATASWLVEVVTGHGERISVVAEKSLAVA